MKTLIKLISHWNFELFKLFIKWIRYSGYSYLWMVRFEFSTELNSIQPSYYFSDNWKHIQRLAILVDKEIEFGLENNWIWYWSQIDSQPAGDCIWSKHGKNPTPRCKFLFSLYVYDENIFHKCIKFKQIDYEILPQRFKDDCVGESCSPETKTFDYLIQPSTNKCNTANVVVTIKSAADHFGEFIYTYETGSIKLNMLIQNIVLRFENHGPVWLKMRR